MGRRAQAPQPVVRRQLERLQHRQWEQLLSGLLPGVLLAVVMLMLMLVLVLLQQQECLQALVDLQMLAVAMLEVREVKQGQ